MAGKTVYIVGRIKAHEGVLSFVGTSGEWENITISKKEAKRRTHWGDGDNDIYRLVKVRKGKGG